MHVYLQESYNVVVVVELDMKASTLPFPMAPESSSLYSSSPSVVLGGWKLLLMYLVQLHISRPRRWAGWRRTLEEAGDGDVTLGRTSSTGIRFVQNLELLVFFGGWMLHPGKCLYSREEGKKRVDQVLCFVLLKKKGFFFISLL